jgi:hypothetical protein
VNRATAFVGKGGVRDALASDHRPSRGQSLRPVAVLGPPRRTLTVTNAVRAFGPWSNSQLRFRSEICHPAPSIRLNHGLGPPVSPLASSTPASEFRLRAVTVGADSNATHMSDAARHSFAPTASLAQARSRSSAPNARGTHPGSLRAFSLESMARSRSWIVTRSVGCDLWPRSRECALRRRRSSCS